MSAEDYLPDGWQAVLKGIYNGETFDGQDEARERFLEDQIPEEPMTNKPYESVKCPSCNGEMVSRKGKYGVFWGCKSFPQCKGTRDSQGRSRDERNREETNDRDYHKDLNDKDELDTVMRNVAKYSFTKKSI